MALAPWKYDGDRGSSRGWVLIIAPVRQHNKDIFSIFIKIKVCCVLSLELPHWGDSNEYTQYTIFNIKKKTTFNYSKSAAIEFFPMD